MTPIFVYGTLLSHRRMQEVVRSAIPREPATLYKRQLEFRGGLATVEPTSHDEYVLGALYDIDATDIWLLDWYERHDPLHPETSLYNRVQEHVVHDDGSQELAVMYVMLAGFARTLPSPETLTTIVRGYADWGLNIPPLARALERVR